MAKGITFTPDSAKRIGDVVRRVEQSGPVISRAPRGRQRWPRRYQWLFEVTAVDTVAGTCTAKRRDDAAGTLIDPEVADVYYDADNEPSVDDIGILTRLGNGNVLFHPGGVAQPIDPPVPDNTVGTTDETDAAQADTWAVGDGTLKVIMLTRMAYNHEGDEKLYGYYRDFKYDAYGRLTSVSGEVRVIIETPKICS